MRDFLRGGGVQLIRSPRKNASPRGSSCGPNVKNLHRGPNGRPDPRPPPHLGSATVHLFVGLGNVFV